MIKITKILICLFCAINAFAQNNSSTLLKAKFENESADSIYKIIDRHLILLDSIKAPVRDKIDALNLRVDLSDSLFDCYESLSGYQRLSQYAEFLSGDEYYKVLQNTGAYLSLIGDKEEAMTSFFSAAELAEKLKNDTLKAEIYRIIGVQYKNFQNRELSLKYLNESLGLFESFTDTIGILNCCMSIGNLYNQDRKLDTAILYFTKSLDLSLKINHVSAVGGNYNNIGNVHYYREDYDSALVYFFLALEHNLANGKDNYIAKNYNNIGCAYNEKGIYDKAILYLNKSLILNQKLKLENETIETYEILGEINSKKGNHSLAYEYQLKASELRKSYNQLERTILSDQLEAKFQKERNEAEIKALKTEKSLQEIVILSQDNDLEYQKTLRSKEKTIFYALIFILLILIVTFIVFWRNNLQRKKYTEQLKTKNSEIANAQFDLERKNQEVTDSINYAKRIQAAILPSEKTLHALLKEAFVLYLPKDIVAGDFYWAEQINNTLLFAVADCTGHGVPGALVSVICHNALNTAIKQVGTSDPGKILDETTALVLKKFEKSEQKVRDGMDIGLCSFDLESRTLKFAGAHTPLWIVRDKEIIKYDATRQPVGSYGKLINFESATIEIQNGDMLYLTSDGYVDQFGGEKGKKFMQKRFKELLITISQDQIEDQKVTLIEQFQQWKGENAQVDDICVLGTRVDYMLKGDSK